MLRGLLLPIALCVACGSRGDGTLGAQVATAIRPIELSKITDMDELDRALRQNNDRALGAHVRSIKTELAIAGPKNETLVLTGILESNGKDRLHVVHDTSHEDGYEAFIVEGRLHVRPRYLQMTWHRPEPGEVANLRAPIEQSTADYVARIAKDAEIGKQANGDRITVTVQGASGSARLELDGKSGALLSATLEAKLQMESQGKAITVTAKHEDKVLFEARTIEAPTTSVAQPRRPRPQLDKQTLLGPGR